MASSNIRKQSSRQEMPPKRKDEKKKKAQDMEHGGLMGPEDQAKHFQLQCQSLQIQLAERTDESTRAAAAKRSLESRVEDIKREFLQDQRTTFEITQDMTRQYKCMQEELLTRINKLEEKVQSLNDQLEEADLRHGNVIRERDAIIRGKGDEIAQLKARMEDMAEEFGEMLRETLEKMRERIEISSSSFDTDVPIVQRVEEF